MKNNHTHCAKRHPQYPKNVIALIVIFGITIVPSLYAWFNIAASWDPYKIPEI